MPDILDELTGPDPAEEHAKEVEIINQAIADWTDTFGTPHGKRVAIDLLKLLGECFIFSPDHKIFTGNSNTYYRAALHDWQKAFLEKLATFAPDVYMEICRNHAQDLQDRLTARYSDEG